MESDIFYVAVFPQKETVVFNKERFMRTHNLLADIFPEDSKYEDVIRVYDIDSEQLQIMSDVVSQRAVCFFA